MIHKWLDSGKQKSLVLWPQSMAIDTHVVVVLVFLTVIRCSGMYNITLSDLIDNSSFFFSLSLLPLFILAGLFICRFFFWTKASKIDDIFFWGGCPLGYPHRQLSLQMLITMHTIRLSHALQMEIHYNAQIYMQTNNRNNYRKPSSFRPMRLSPKNKSFI